MVILVSGSTKTVARLAGHPNLGVLITPASGNNAPPAGTRWAADNSAFSGFDDACFRQMLSRIRSRPDCMWVTAPDVVGVHAETLERWWKYLPIILEHGQLASFVAQDGCTVESLPWGSGMSGVFIGGSTAWKLGSEAARIVHEAKLRGIWSHMGRVNTIRRLMYANIIGVNSVDGTSFSRYGEVYIPRTLDLLEQLDRQSMIPLRDGFADRRGSLEAS